MIATPGRHTIAFCLLVVLAFGSIATAQNPVPLINQPLVPDATKPGGAGFTLTVNGTGFVSGAVVKWNGSARATIFVSSSKVTASIAASDIAAVKTASVTVVNPGPGGGTSNVAFFEVTPPTSSVGMAAVPYATADRSYSVAVGDFNRDGKLDLAVADYATNTVSVLLGNGDGTFQAHVAYATGRWPELVVVGDFRGDGKLDLVVSNSGDNNISVLLGNGDGTFQPAANYSVTGGVAVGDFYRDGKLDLAVADSTSININVLLGNGDGTFQLAGSYSIPSAPTSMAVADFNADGKLDLVVATNGNVSNNTVSILLGNGDGTFQAHVDYQTGTKNPASVAVGDFNGDGKLDLVVADLFSTDVRLLLGDGDGTFGAAATYAAGSGPSSVAMGDFNADGRLDIAVADSGSATVSVLLQGLQNTTDSLSETSLTFSGQVVGTTSAPQTVTLTNTGTLRLIISSIAVTGTNASDFSQINTCDSSLPSGGKCTITVTFTPNDKGPRTASVTINDNTGGSPQEIALSGTGTGPSAILSPISLIFVTQPLGTSSPAQSVTLSNDGTVALSITSISFTGADPGDFAQTNTCGISIAPGASCTINVTFDPAHIGARTANLSVTDNGPGSPQTVSVAGVGTVVQLNPSSLKFFFVTVGSSKTLSTTLTNVGKTTLSISGITITGPFFAQTNSCGSSVAGGGSCTINVTFTPSTVGPWSADIRISDNGGGSPQLVPLSGFACPIGGCHLK